MEALGSVGEKRVRLSLVQVQDPLQIRSRCVSLGLCPRTVYVGTSQEEDIRERSQVAHEVEKKHVEAQEGRDDEERAEAGSHPSEREAGGDSQGP